MAPIQCAFLVITESLGCPHTYAVKLPAQYKTGSETDHSHPIPCPDPPTREPE